MVTIHFAGSRGAMKRRLLLPVAIRYARQEAATVLVAFDKDCQFVELNSEMR